ncbi:DUF6542 domain-containing protein [Streptomyces gamaensis]|uniref:DUF6542 domain-containing protein n=1 Tax=Streptomyces gamaensis TaxID=1763542 RepID=A0ABW0Z0T4_9ACTN
MVNTTRPLAEVVLPDQRHTPPRGTRRRTASPQPPRRRGRPGAAALLLVGGPLLGAVVTGGGLGPVFGVCSLLGAAAASWLCSRPGLWWTVTTAPVVVLLVALGARAATDSDTSNGAALATHALGWVAQAFVVMVVTLAATLAVTAVRMLRERGESRG